MSQPLEHPRIPPSSDRLICDDGEPLETGRHRQQMSVLIDSLEFAWQGRDDFYVGGNMFLYFSETQSRRNDFRGPDVFVVLNTTRRERLAWVVWEEDGKAPDVIIELLSAKTEHVDRGEKMAIYGRTLKVGEYFLFDPLSGKLEGYELDALRRGYVPKVPDREGRLRCEQLDLYLAKVTGTLHAVEADWLRWMDREGRLLELPSEYASLAERRASAAERRASAAERRASAAERRAGAEVERADAAEARARAEAERAEQLAAELAALKAKRDPA